MKVCYAQQMRNIDKAASDIGAIPSIVLMENAALACVNELEKDFGDLKGKRVSVFCGKGNNGGDGFAIARHLINKGAETNVYLVCGSDFHGDAEINYNIIDNMGVSIEEVHDLELLEYIVRASDIVVDAIYGTGVHGIIRGIGYEVIPIINENAKYILSVDIPSGLNTDSGEICGVCIKATKTVTFAAWKIGMLMFPGADYTGKVVLNNISIPEYIIDHQNILIDIIDDELVKSCIDKRSNNSQKGNYGKVLIIAGSVGMSGAAYMSSSSALKAGAGIVTVASCESVSAALEVKTTEAMTIPLAEKDGHISIEAIDYILDNMEKYDSILIGPGLGRSSDVTELVRKVLENSNVPVIVDADAINAVAKDLQMVKKCGCPLIFTPHEMEMARLVGTDVEYVSGNRLKVSEEFCEEYGITLILKGHHTIVTSPDLRQYINITGNAGMATGGSGDVLAGMVAALAARGIDETYAAAAAVRLHGEAGDRAAKITGEESLTATDILEAIRL